MQTSADWIVVSGFLLAIFGIVLRVVLMMRSADSSSPQAASATARSLIQTYKSVHPTSKLPLVTWFSIAIGFVLLVAGTLLEFR